MTTVNLRHNYNELTATKGTVKQRVKFKTNKFQNKKKSGQKEKKHLIDLFSRRSCDLILSSWKVCRFREK